MGFTGSNSTHELEAQADLEQFPDPTDEIDYEIEIDYDQELADFEALPEQDFEEPANFDLPDLFEYFFRVQAERAREAFILNGN